MRVPVYVAASAVVISFLASTAQAADPVNGKLIYQNGKSGMPACAGCHGIDPANGTNNIAKGSDWTVIKNAISLNKGGMGMFSAVLTDADLQDIAAYIANPAAGTASPLATLAPTALGFGNQTLGIPSSVRSATFSNTGSAPLTIQNITVGGANTSDFARSGTCAISQVLNAGAACSIDVTFTPLASGDRSATVSIAHNAAGSPTALALTGTGIAPTTTAPAVTLNPAALDFGTVSVGAGSAAKTAQLTNSGNAALLLADIVVEGANASDFSRTTDCPLNGSLAAGASCTISVMFAPTASGARSADVAIQSNATGAATVKLTGSGAAVSLPPGPAPGASLKLSAAALDFGPQSIGRTSRAMRVVVTNSGSAALSIDTVSVTGDFVQRNNCAGQVLQPGTNCTIAVRFRPIAVGVRAGDLAIASNATGSPHHVTLSGLGQAGRAKDASADECDDDDGLTTSTTCSVMTSPLGKPAPRRR